MLVQNSPKASQEKHLLRGFSFCGCGTVLSIPDSRKSGWQRTIGIFLAVLLGVVPRRGSC